MFSCFYQTVLGTNKFLHWEETIETSIMLQYQEVIQVKLLSLICHFSYNKFVLIKEFREVARNFKSKALEVKLKSIIGETQKHYR